MADVELPNPIPLFPLPNVVLFPGVPLPLHIFEPRYREMVRAAVDGEQMIGMVLLRGDWQASYEGNPPIFDVGCGGRLSRVEALPDGRFNILLHGVREFRVLSESFEHSYRLATVDWRPAAAGLPAGGRPQVLAGVRRLLETQPDSPLHGLLKDESLSDELLVNFFSYALDHGVLEKQSLLQADGLAARARQLVELIDFRLEAQRSFNHEPGSDLPH